MNHLKTYILMAGLTGLFGVAGLLIGGVTGMLLALAIGAAMNLFSYWNADRIVLKLYRAVEVEADHPSHEVRNYLKDTTDLAQRAGMPVPRIYIIESDQPNAFATGRNPRNAAVAATTGLLRLLERDEIRGVMAHELAHVKNRDTLTMTITATIAGAISSLANFAFFFGGGNDGEDRPAGLLGTIAVAILAPVAAMLVQMAISRTREYEADKVGAEIAGDPRALASALEKIEAYARGGVVNQDAERNPATAHMFIINPLSGQGVDNLFSTHPATHNRVAALARMSGTSRATGSAATSVPASPDPTERSVSRPWG